MVGHIVYGLDALLLADLLDGPGLMDLHIVHEDGDPLEPILPPQIQQVLLEFLSVNRFVKDLVKLQAILF